MSDQHPTAVSSGRKTPIQTRPELSRARRIVIKLGTQVVVDAEGRPALGRLYGLMEAVAAMAARGCQPVLVSSGAVGLGARRLGIHPRELADKQASAAVGQGELMSLYQDGLGRLGFPAAQVLLTEDDFADPTRHANLKRTLETLLSLGTVPVLNENDTVSTLELERPAEDRTPIFSDNDHLSALVAAHLDADLLVLLSDVTALHTRNPGLDPTAEPILDVPYASQPPVEVQGSNGRGRGGMASKLTAARLAAAQGVPVVMASGLMPQVLERILAGDPVGTLFAPNPDPAAPSHPILADNPVRPLAQAAREASRRLAVTDGATRNHALAALADVLLRKTHRILAANERDLDAAVSHISNSAYQRLRLDEAKLREMAAGVRAVAALPDPLHHVQLRRSLDEGLELTRVSCPLGVLGVVFESRPDALIQISALALKSGNAVLLKGGHEALHSNAALLSAVQEALQAVGLPVAAVQGLEDRASVEALLSLPELVDLVIPRGSNALVKRIQSATRIPVLGHAEGICHMYLDATADPTMAAALVRDAKLQYPSACNAVETVLVHAAAAPRLLPLLAADLRSHQVELRGCAQCQALVPDLAAATAEDWDTEYGEPILAIKVVRDLDEALEHIRHHGSGHTEAIVTEDPAAAARFLAEVDAAGVYHNASTRFADGFRYGFGAEVGISTGRIHARGPVGLEGLLSHRYLLRGQGQRVADYAGPSARPFLHRDLPIES